MSDHCKAHFDLSIQQEANAFIGIFMGAFGSSALLRRTASGQQVIWSLASRYVFTLLVGKILSKYPLFT